MSDKYRGHKPKLADFVTKREECEVCGASWLRGRPCPGPCPGSEERTVTPVLGITPVLRGGLYRGRTKMGS